MKKWKTRSIIILAFGLTFILGLGSSLLVERSMASSSGLNLQGQSDEAPEIPLAKDASECLPANIFVELYKRVNPAVVNISTTIGGRRMMVPQDPLFDFFQQFMGPQGGMMMQAPPAQALGSGFIISSDGLILTNNHVVENANSIKVQLRENSNKFYEAKVLGRDARTDVALIKIETGSKLPVAQLGSSKDLQVGEWVAAFGNPFGHGHTISKGIISAKDRSINEINRFPFLQTDAEINPGNSGGPLVNIRGQVIGINTAIDARAQGIGFAIPIDDVKSVLVQLEKYGTVKHGWLGVALKDLTPQEASYFGLNSLDGTMIVEVEPRSPAAEAGMRQYDVVTHFGDRKINNAEDLKNAVADANIGDTVEVKIIRDGTVRTLHVKVVQAPSLARHEPHFQRQLGGESVPFHLGFKVSSASEHVRRAFGISQAPGPVVTEIDSNSLADQQGLELGDVILEVNREAVKTPEDVIHHLKKGENMLRIIRRNMARIIYLSTQ